MNKKHSIKQLILSSIIASTIASFASTAVATSTQNNYKNNLQTCEFELNWLKNPQPLNEVAQSDLDESGDPDSSFCDFYRFSWQNFLYLVSPVDRQKAKNNQYYATFQQQAKYPLLEADGKNSCDAQVTNRTLFVRKTKNDNHQDPLVIPERIEQAGSHAVIYDQQGNIVLYEVRFSKNMCDLKLIQNQPYFPAGTTELKQAWKIMTPSDNTEQYFTMDAKVQFEDGQTTESLKLGLIGFHIAISTDDHPEMIWITYEHKTNVPNCKQPITSDEKALVANTQWSFTSKACAESINQAGQFNNTCHFNQPLKNQTATKGIPTEICRVNHNGTSPNQDVQQNNQPLNQLNNAFQQQDLSASNQWARVWQNYMMVGALWLSQPYNAVKTNAFNPSAASFGKQRGSLALANSVMETDFQDVGSNLSGNCFGCHNFKVNQGSSTLPTKALIAQHNKDTSKIEWEKETLEGSSGALSHIMNKIIAGQCDINYLPENLLFAQFGSLDIGKVSKYCQKTCQSNNQAWTGNYKLIKTRGGQLPETRNQCECCQYKTQL